MKDQNIVPLVVGGLEIWMVQRNEMSSGIRVRDGRHTLMSVLTMHFVVVVLIITSECRHACM